MSDVDRSTSAPAPRAVQTTGHSWDGDLQEFNNPLPRWWLWSFYATVVFAVIYWIFYPAWPVGDTWTRGIATVSYTGSDGEVREIGWNTRAELLRELNDSPAAQRQREYLNRVGAMEFDAIVADPEMLAFARAAGRSLFGDNCAGCHGVGGQGVMGLYPNLADDAWLWGGTMEHIEETLYLGRQGYMPGYAETLSPEQLSDVAHYVLSLSDEVVASEAVARGEAIFQGAEGGCHQCHGRDGGGRTALGSANLTDRIWTIANVPGAPTESGKVAVLARFIGNGVLNMRNMPAWNNTALAEVAVPEGETLANRPVTNGSQDRLTPEEIKLLAVYVHQLGGGQ
ncbi:MAG: cytochrome-c oxidase, cbb3-type subunit III [Candidatus Competibacterales bacterium]